MKLPERFTSVTFLSYLLIFLFITGLFTSNFFRALPSISLALLFILAVWYRFFSKKGSRTEGSQSFLKQKQFLFPALIFIYYLITTVNTGAGNEEMMVQALAMKVPFLIFGFSFAVLPALKERQYHTLLYFFFILLLISILWTLLEFLQQDYEQVIHMYKASKVMETPVNHVRYSLMVAFGTFIGFYLWSRKGTLFFRWEKYLLAGGSFFMFLFLHLLSVRSGLLAVYIEIFAVLLYITVRRRKFVLGISAVIIAILVPAIAYMTVPTLQNKVSNTMEDLEKINIPGYADHYSLVGRVYSYRVSLALIKESPVFGTGPANLQEEVVQKYNNQYPAIQNPLLPHSQYLYLLVATGIAGTCIFLFCFYYPVFASRRFEPVLFMQYLIVSFSFLVESTVETQLGVNYTLIFIFLPLLYIKDKKLPGPEKELKLNNY